MKTLPMIALLGCTLTSASTFAGQECDIDLDANFALKNNHITFSNDSHELYQITADNQLIIKNETLDLNSEQAESVAQFADSVRHVVPQVQTIAGEGGNIAIEGVNLAFDGLLGEGNDVSAELSQELVVIRDALEAKFDSDEGVYFGKNMDMGEDLLGEDFEQRFEQTLERAIENSMGSLLMAVGREMISSGGDMETFEARMEDFGKDIETQVEARAETLELAALELCQSMVDIDALETQMQETVPALSNIDVLQISHKRTNEI